MTRVACLLTLMLAIPAVAGAETVTSEDEWQHTFPVTADTPNLVVRNVWGPVAVRNGPAQEIRVSVRSRYAAPDDQRLERTRLLLAVEVDAAPGGVELHVGDSYRVLRREDLCHRCRATHDIEVVVPRNSTVDVATVNDGVVRVSGVGGRVTASNVNGAVVIAEAVACDSVESVNGDVELEFASRPAEACQLETVNGDIHVGVPGGSDLDLALDLFNGRIVTDFDVSAFAVPAVVEKSESNGEFRYRVSQSAGLRIGRGGPLFSIASLNGDVNIVRKP